MLMANSNVCPTVKPSVIVPLFSFFCGREQLEGIEKRQLRKSIEACALEKR